MIMLSYYNKIEVGNFNIVYYSDLVLDEKQI